MLEIILKVLFSVFLMFSFVWAFLPGMFGVANFCKGKSERVTKLAYAAWIVLMLIHAPALYATWALNVSKWLIFLILLCAQIAFFKYIANDIS